MKNRNVLYPPDFSFILFFVQGVNDSSFYTILLQNYSISKKKKPQTFTELSVSSLISRSDFQIQTKIIPLAYA